MAQKKKVEKDLQQELRESAHKIWLAGLGALATAEESGNKVFKTLVDKGEKFEERGKKQFGDMKDRVKSARDEVEDIWEKLGETFDDRVSGAIHRLGVPTRDEIRMLSKRVEELTRKVDQLKPKRTAKKTTTAKARKTA